jgi:ATP-dependent Zn protease
MAVKSNDEREQTLNQLLYEIDGFDALGLLTTHEKALREIARVLQEDEVISGETVSKIVAEAPH